eukprot:1141678-Pelagomonas_calceolata.AAC.3
MACSYTTFRTEMQGIVTASQSRRGLGITVKAQSQHHTDSHFEVKQSLTVFRTKRWGQECKVQPQHHTNSPQCSEQEGKAVLTTVDCSVQVNDVVSTAAVQSSEVF